MLATAPVNREDDLSRAIVVIGDDLARRICWRDRMVTPDAFQAASRSSASPTNSGISAAEPGVSIAPHRFVHASVLLPSFFQAVRQ